MFLKDGVIDSTVALCAQGKQSFLKNCCLSKLVLKSILGLGLHSTNHKDEETEYLKSQMTFLEAIQAIWCHRLQNSDGQWLLWL